MPSCHRRWFILEVETEERADGTHVRTGKLSYYHTSKDAKESPEDGVQIPLHETMSVKPSMGKTKGTEHRITLQTAKREWELGSGEDAVAKDWVETLQMWVGLPKVERARGESIATGARMVKAQWMECRVNVYKPEEITDEELARSNTIQKTVSSFSRTFTLSRNKPKEDKVPEPEKPPEDEDEDEDEDDEGVFNWVRVQSSECSVVHVSSCAGLQSSTCPVGLVVSRPRVQRAEGLIFFFSGLCRLDV